MQTTLRTWILLLPAFVSVESARVVLWAARTAEEPDRDGPLLRALFALLVNLLSVVPSPVWAVVMYIAWVVWVPVRAVLWLWGIGRGESVKKRSPSAVTRWYADKRKHRAKMFQRRGSQYE